MTPPELKPNDSISSLTVADLESLVAQIVQKTLQQKQSSWDAQIQQVKQKLAEPYDTTARSLADVAIDLAAQAPEEDWAKVPTDASMRYKQYLRVHNFTQRQL